MPIELPKDYYLDYFDRLISFVKNVYDDLFSKEDKVKIAAYHELPLDSKRVLLRMVMRKGDIFRLSKLQYAEVDQLPKALALLSKKQFVRPITQSNELALCLNKFTKAELIAMFPQCSMSSLKKEDLLAKLLTEVSPESIAIAMQNSDHLYLLESQQFFLKMFLLYFGNPYQDLTEFVLNHLGLMQYENYSIDETTRPFSTSGEIETSLHLFALQVLFIDIEARQAFVECKVLYQELKTLYDLAKKPAGFDSLLISIGRFLEKCKQADEALPFFEMTNKEPSRERRARILYGNSLWPASAKLIHAMIENPFSEKEREVGLVLNKKLKKYSLALLLDEAPEKPFVEETLFLENKEGLSVEELVCEYYDGKGGDAYFYENQFIGGLLGMAFWDIIFSPEVGAFYHPFQLGPTDLFSLDFYLQRKKKIDKRLSDLEDGTFGFSEMLVVLEKKYGISNYLVQWDLFDEDLLRKTWSEIPIKVLSSIFKRQLLDMRQFHSGMPDVLHFPKEGGYCFVEVKGPGDKLQTNQRNWFRFFSSNGINSKIMWVKWKNQ